MDSGSRRAPYGGPAQEKRHLVKGSSCLDSDIHSLATRGVQVTL